MKLDAHTLLAAAHPYPESTVFRLPKEGCRAHEKGSEGQCDPHHQLRIPHQAPLRIEYGGVGRERKLYGAQYIANDHSECGKELEPGYYHRPV